MARIFTTQDGIAPEDLFQSACDHLSAARLLATTSPSHLDSAGYLAHIALELSLKSWLLFLAGQFSSTHSLWVLYKELMQAHAAPELPPRLSDLLTIFDSYSELRYPNRNAPTEVGSEDIAQLEELFMHLYQFFPPNLYEAIYKLDPTKKGGRVLMKKKVE